MITVSSIFETSVNLPSGGLVAMWEDYGGNLGSGAGKPDIAVEFMPLPVLRSAGGAE